jgi:hypothetical protein
VRLQHLGVLASAAALGGCGSSWSIDSGIIKALAKQYYYPDADADGWGDPGSTPQLLDAADDAHGLTATNDRDCAVDDDQITGLIGQLCPGDFAGGSQSVGVSYPGAEEYAATHGSGEVTRVLPAMQACTGWGAQIEADGITPAFGHLATFSSSADLGPLQAEIEADGAFAAWIGILWSTDDPTSGNWVWEDDTAPSSIETEFSWCNGSAPSPYDLFPFAVLNPDAPEQAAVIAEDLPFKRLALVWRAGATDWCLGIPTDALADAAPAGAPYTVDDAHVVCERPYPDPAQYLSNPPAEGASGE